MESYDDKGIILSRHGGSPSHISGDDCSFWSCSNTSVGLGFDGRQKQLDNVLHGAQLLGQTASHLPLRACALMKKNHGAVLSDSLLHQKN